MSKYRFLGLCILFCYNRNCQFFNHCAQRLVKRPTITYKVTHVIISFFYICRNGFISLFRGKFPESRFLMSHSGMSHVCVHNGRGYDGCCNLMSGCYSGCINGHSKSSKDLKRIYDLKKIKLILRKLSYLKYVLRIK